MSKYSFQQLLPYQEYLASYFSQLGGDVAVMGRIAAAYAVNEASPPAQPSAAARSWTFRPGPRRRSRHPRTILELTASSSIRRRM